MNVLAFAVYAFCCVLVLGGQMAFALREWRWLPRRMPMAIDQLYVRIERYFGLAFRARLEQWLQREPADITPDGVRIIDKSEERIQVHDHVVLGDGERFDDILVASGLVTGDNCRLAREAYSRQHCRIGGGNVLQALAADGDILLGRGTQVMRWVDAAGEIMIEPNCRVEGRVTSALRVLLQTGAVVKSAHAPVLLTLNGHPNGAPKEAADANRHPDLVLSDPDAWKAAGAEALRRELAPDCTVYDGDLTLPSVEVPGNLVVQGSLTLGPRSILRGDVRAAGTIHVGAHSTCEGSLVGGRDIHLGPYVRFHGVIMAEGAVRIARGVHGSRPHPGVAVYGATTVIVGPDVEVHGKIAAGRHVLVAAE